jgi:hypothetical protein
LAAIFHEFFKLRRIAAAELLEWSLKLLFLYIVIFFILVASWKTLPWKTAPQKV